MRKIAIAKISTAKILTAISLTAVLAGQAMAADLPTAKEPPAPVLAAPAGWQYRVSGYGFLTSLSGEIGVGRLPSAEADVPFGTILRHMQGAFAGNAVARNETFYLSIDGMWAKIGGTSDIRFKPGPLFGTQASLTQQLGFATAFAGYRVPLGSPDFSLYAGVGARYEGISANFGLFQYVSGFGFGSSGSAGWVDPLIGVAMHYRINEKYFLEATADLGGFGAASRITTQDQVTVGYNWTNSISTSLGYRVLYVDYQKSNANGGSFRYNTTMYGPYVAVGYSF